MREKNNNTKKTSYADYYVEGYFNDKKIFNVSADEFMKKIEAEIWSQEKVDDYCGFDINPVRNNTDNSNKKDNAKTAYKVLMIVFICLSAILLAATILLAYKLSQRREAPID